MYWPVAVLNVVFFRSGPGVIKLFFMLNSDEHEIFYANKYENASNSWHYKIY